MENIKVILSKRFSLLTRDYIRAAIMAGLTSAFMVIQNIIDSGQLVFNWKVIGMTSLASAVGYLFKNGLLEPTKVITTVPEKKADPVVVTDEIKTLVS